MTAYLISSPRLEGGMQAPCRDVETLHSSCLIPVFCCECLCTSGPLKNVPWVLREGATRGPRAPRLATQSRGSEREPAKDLGLFLLASGSANSSMMAGAEMPRPGATSWHFLAFPRFEF